MKKITLFSGIFLASLFISINFVSCKKNPTAPQNEPESLDQPNLPATTYTYYAKHGVNDNLATLGRVLFYDKNLSVNKGVSCGSCHKQEFAFADNVKVNKGFNGINLSRNSPSIQGLKGFLNNNGFEFVNGQMLPIADAGMPTMENQAKMSLFWDSRQDNMADMVLNPVLNHNEMNMPDFETLITRLNELSYYPPLFKKAFGDEGAITKEKIAFAIEGFISCLNTERNLNNPASGSFESQQQTDPEANLSPIEKQGRFLFHSKYNCAKCHDPSHTGGYDGNTMIVDQPLMFNIGLDEVYSDNGLGKITGKEGDKGLFKVPTLKNISVTAPYMHDGRFNNLSEVIDHYSHNIKNNRNLTGEFRDFSGSPKKLNINSAEKQALIAFLNTLKDEDFLTSVMYSDPFKK
jgi:cytochrome c peroxidase